MTGRARELAGVEVGGLTRSAFVLRGALAAGAAGGLGAIGPFVSRALAKEEPGSSGGRDVEILQFALTLEQLEADFYARALRDVPGLGGEARTAANALRDAEREHVDALEEAVRDLGARPEPAPRFDFGRAFRSERAFLALAQTFEDTGVSAYNGAAPQLQSRDLLTTAAAIAQVEARHSAEIRLLRGEPFADSAFDDDLTAVETNRLLAPYL